MRPKTQHLVLMALKDGPKHGYQIIKYIEEKTQYFSMGYGTLYPALHSLENEKSIKGEWEAAGENKEKKIYELTAKGRKEVSSVTEEFRAFSKALSKLMGAT
ncbi:MAG: PadR family transcriptional regulator [Oligoflexales bacterium]